MSSPYKNFRPNAESSALNVESNSLLLVTLSTVVMMAKEKDVPKEFLDCSKFYLENVKDEEGKILPNTQWMLNKIKNYGNQEATTAAATGPAAPAVVQEAAPATVNPNQEQTS